VERLSVERLLAEAAVFLPPRQLPSPSIHQHHHKGNCDAEGRLILADALFEAASSQPVPDLIIDAATLTVIVIGLNMVQMRHPCLTEAPRRSRREANNHVCTCAGTASCPTPIHPSATPTHPPPHQTHRVLRAPLWVLSCQPCFQTMTLRGNSWRPQRRIRGTRCGGCPSTAATGGCWTARCGVCGWAGLGFEAAVTCGAATGVVSPLHSISHPQPTSALSPPPPPLRPPDCGYRVC